MFWADILAKNFKERDSYLVNDAKTPSGKIHVGSLRGVLIHDFVHKALLELGKKSHYTYHFDDFDPMDGLPVYLEQEKYSQYMGKPLKDVPSPEGSGSYAEYYAKDFLKVFNSLGAKPEIIWSSQLYESGKLDEAIKIALDNAEKIQEIYHRVSGSQKKEGWLPFQPVCENCGKIGTTHATNWDGKTVEYSCEEDLVEWAKGCGHSGKVSPFGGTGKMPYKVEWSAKWFSLKVTVEGAGKDHSSKGGTRDVANTIAKEVFKIEPPADIAYEHILFGGKKMSSSKGLGSSAAEVAQLLPPEILRFLFARVPYQRAIDFDPTNPNTIPDLFDEFDRGQSAFFKKTNEDLAKTWEASQIGSIKEEFNVRFSTLISELKNLKTEDSILVEAEKAKSEKLTNEDREAIKLRIKYAQIWLEKFGQAETEEVVELNSGQKELLKIVAEGLSSEMSEDEIQTFIYNKGKELDLKPVEAFQAVYVKLLGKSSGPKAGELIKSFGVKEAKKKFNDRH
ncbi:MAG TPA: lysine--tRNA ligase [Candidatus Saccharimonadales bacterium]|nr:lysine--tRNA ligase [Candidatus Saccharimonadales bacterium]